MEITLRVPEQHGLAEDPAELGRRVALYAALLMFRAGELSAGAAAEFAGVDRFMFAAACQQHGIPLIDYSPEELQVEVDSVRQAS
jgi:predicted HTH domain antitoxin